MKEVEPIFDPVCFMGDIMRVSDVCVLHLYFTGSFSIALLEYWKETQEICFPRFVEV